MRRFRRLWHRLSAWWDEQWGDYACDACQWIAMEDAHTLDNEYIVWSRVPPMPHTCVPLRGAPDHDTEEANR